MSKFRTWWIATGCEHGPGALPWKGQLLRRRVGWLAGWCVWVALCGPSVAFTQSEGEPPIAWGAHWPDVSKPAAGLPLVEGAEHFLVYRADEQTGTYSHGPRIAHHDGWFLVAWKCHARDEDAAGQRVLYSRSRDGRTWSTAEPLFDSLTPMNLRGEVGVILECGGFTVLAERLYALAGVDQIAAFTDHARTRQVTHMDRQFNEPVRRRLGRLLRRVEAGQPAGEPCWLAPQVPTGAPRYSAYVDRDAAIRSAATELLRREAAERIGPLPEAAERARLCEAVHYTRPDGKQVRLFRDDLYSLRLFASVRDSAEQPWPPARKTNIPDSPSLTTVGTLPDGRIYLLGNQLPQQWLRDPLTLALSRDGRVFDQVWAVRAGAPPLRHAGANKGPGYQYPGATVVGDDLWVTYSIGKEDVGVTRVPIRSLRDDQAAEIPAQSEPRPKLRIIDLLSCKTRPGYDTGTQSQ